MPSRNNNTGSRLTIHRYRKPTIELAQLAQPIGYAAWKERLTHRPDDQIRNVFDPDNPSNAEKLLARMNSKVGKFVGVVSIMDGRQVGYAWAADDVGNLSPAMQKAKTLAGKIKGKKPYAWNAHINVLPKYQGIGVGTVLLHELFEPFEESQKPTAYVFDENRITLDWFMKRGFSPRPDEPADPNENPDSPDIYFGDGADHVSQWRLEAPSIDIVLDYPTKPRYVVMEV